MSLRIRDGLIISTTMYLIIAEGELSKVFLSKRFPLTFNLIQVYTERNFSAKFEVNKSTIIIVTIMSAYTLYKY